MLKDDLLDIEDAKKYRILVQISLIDHQSSQVESKHMDAVPSQKGSIIFPDRESANSKVNAIKTLLNREFGVE